MKKEYVKPSIPNDVQSIVINICSQGTCNGK